MNEVISSRRSHSTASASTKVTQRPGSRGSTASIQSLDHRAVHRQHHPQHHHNNAHILSYNAPPPNSELSAIESALLQMSGAGRQMDQSTSALLDSSFGVQHHLEDHTVAAPQANGSFTVTNYPQNHGFVHRHSVSQSTAFEAPNPQDTDTGRRKGGSATATNDRELRELLSRNDGRSLKDVATEVSATERTPRAERTKQLFAMLWLKAVCRKAKTSVPRNRVYSFYATRCGTERVVPLNPASFGKLVRIIFPGIATRRLGVRGESKYHYVDLALVEDEQMGSVVLEANAPNKARNSSVQPSRQASISNASMFQSFPRLTADTAAFPSHEKSLESPTQSTTEAAFPSQSRVYAEPNAPWLHSNNQTSQMYNQHLRFPPPNEIPDETDSVELPSIQEHLPPKTDIDAINNLLACYRSHCTSLIDCIRFCKEKQFFRLFTSFHGTLTVPAQKLFAHTDIAAWIKECDWMMYQKMIRFVSQLTLQVVPPVVLKFLDAICKGLHAHICKVFQGFPLHVLEAKLEPATLFANLLHRMLRANQTAHAAAALLIVDQNREQMWQDWVTYVNPKRIMESELPGCGYDEVFNVLTRDVRNLLQPLSSPNWLDGTDTAQSGLDDSDLSGLSAQMSNETIIDRLSQFIGGLPARFPQASTRTLLSCISNVTTAAIREITVENGVSFGFWWITKVFIDEMSLWLASLGGFLDHQPPRPVSYTPQMDPMPDSQFMNGESDSQHDSRFSSIGESFAPNTSFMTSAEDQSQATLPSAGEMNVRPHANIAANCAVVEPNFDNELDDSGIGMSLLDDSSVNMKFAREAALQGAAGFAAPGHTLTAG